MYDSYTKWMKGKGAQFDKIGLKYFYADYRGIVAQENISKGEDIIYVPLAGMITLKMAKQGVVGKKLMDQSVSLIYPNNSFLSTYVLSELANPKTTWTWLFKALPKSVANFPIFFTNEERNLLTGSPFVCILTYHYVYSCYKRTPRRYANRLYSDL